MYRYGVGGLMCVGVVLPCMVSYEYHCSNVCHEYIIIEAMIFIKYPNLRYEYLYNVHPICVVRGETQQPSVRITLQCTIVHVVLISLIHIPVTHSCIV